MGEITYGLERLSLYLQGAEDFQSLIWSRDHQGNTLSYADIFHQYEVEMSSFNFDLADIPGLFQQFDFFESEAQRFIAQALPLPAYEYVMKASHCFNLLDARSAISVTERQRFILRVRTLARGVGSTYFETRKAAGFPLATQADRDFVLKALDNE